MKTPYSSDGLPKWLEYPAVLAFRFLFLVLDVFDGARDRYWARLWKDEPTPAWKEYSEERGLRH